MPLQIGPMRGHLDADPALVLHVLLDNIDNYDKHTPGFDAVRAVLGNGMLASDGAFLKRQRRIVLPTFHGESVRDFASIISRLAAETADEWERAAAVGETVDAYSDMMRVTLRCPGGPVIVSMAPQLELLDRATVASTHAGLNTALESLARGVRMVAIPITNNQPGVARRLEWLGLAEVVLPRRLTSARLRTAVEHVLVDPGYRTRARQRANEIAGLGGLGRAADIGEEAFRTTAPVFA